MVSTNTTQSTMARMMDPSFLQERLQWQAPSWPLLAAGLLGLSVLARGKAHGPGGYKRAIRWFPGQVLAIFQILANPDLGDLLRKGRKKYGDIYYTKQGSKTLLVLNHHDDWAEVMRQETKLKLVPYLPDSTRRIHGKGSIQELASGSQKHQHYRKIFSTLLTPKALETFAPILVDHFARLWKKLEDLSSSSHQSSSSTTTSGKKIMIREHVRDTQFELMAKVLYGIDKANGKTDSKALQQMRIDFEKEENALFLSPFTSRYKEGLAAAQRNKVFLRKRFMKHLEERKGSSASDGGDPTTTTAGQVEASPVGSVMEAVAQDLVRHNLQDDEEILEEIVTNLLLLLEASHGTSIYITTSMLYFLNLPQNQSILQQLRTEVAGLQNNVAKEDLYLTLKNKMPFADGCLHETMRLAPILEAIIYNADDTQKLKLRHQTIPSPQGIFVALTAYTLDETYFDQPHEFLPQRWVAGDPLECPTKSQLALRPMGFGRHICLGQHLARLALKAAVYTFASDPSRTIQFDSTVTRITKQIIFPHALVNDGLMGRVVVNQDE